MLSLMRKHAQSWLIKVALGAIIVVFVFWYGWNYRAQRGNRIAVVNGTPIVLEEFRAVYEQMLQAYRRQFGNALDEKLLESLNLRKQALDQLVDRQQLAYSAASTVTSFRSLSMITGDSKNVIFGGTPYFAVRRSRHSSL